VVAGCVLSIVGLTGALLAWPRNDLIHRVAGRFHESLAMGPFGHGIVLLATTAALVLEVTGLVLWWKRKVIRVQTGAGWRRLMIDLHHATGAVGLLAMLTLAASGLFMATGLPRAHPTLRTVTRIHTARGFPVSLKLLYSAATIGFFVQTATGIGFWWTRRELGRSPGWDRRDKS
jgi:uncharacterized iron-regulated membrane protein